MARFARQHEYRIGRALVVSCAVLVFGAWLVPVDWLRVFGREVRVEAPSARRPSEPWVRLIPVESLPERGIVDLVPVRISTEAAEDSPVADVPASARHTWTFDPTTAFRPLAGGTEPLAPGVPDSVALHRDFLHALRLGNMAPVYALLDTTQAGRAREQLAETDRWFNRFLGPVWAAQGHAAFQADLWWRVVGEVEAEGSH